MCTSGSSGTKTLDTLGRVTATRAGPHHLLCWHQLRSKCPVSINLLIPVSVTYAAEPTRHGQGRTRAAACVLTDAPKPGLTPRASAFHVAAPPILTMACTCSPACFLCCRLFSGPVGTTSSGRLNSGYFQILGDISFSLGLLGPRCLPPFATLLLWSLEPAWVRLSQPFYLSGLSVCLFLT